MDRLIGELVAGLKQAITTGTDVSVPLNQLKNRAKLDAVDLRGTEHAAIIGPVVSTRLRALFNRDLANMNFREIKDLAAVAREFCPTVIKEELHNLIQARLGLGEEGEPLLGFDLYAIFHDLDDTLTIDKSRISPLVVQSLEGSLRKIAMDEGQTSLVKSSIELMQKSVETDLPLGFNIPTPDLGQVASFKMDPRMKGLWACMESGITTLESGTLELNRFLNCDNAMEVQRFTAKYGVDVNEPLFWGRLVVVLLNSQGKQAVLRLINAIEKELNWGAVLDAACAFAKRAGLGDDMVGNIKEVLTQEMA